MTYWIDQDNGMFLVLDFGGVEIFRSRSKIEAECVKHWAQMEYESKGV